MITKHVTQVMSKGSFHQTNISSVRLHCDNVM